MVSYNHHEAFDIIGERVLIQTEIEQKLGIFWESEEFDTITEGKPRPVLDFIQPVYDPNSLIEKFAKGRNPRERINPSNPILSLHLGVDHLKLNYQGMKEGAHIFRGELDYCGGVFFNDGNFECYDKYKKPLKKAGFKIE